jgi:transposase
VPRPADEAALYEAVYDGKPAGSTFTDDRERIARWVARLRRNGWAILPATEAVEGQRAWLDLLLARADEEGETVDRLVRDLLDPPEADNGRDPSELDWRIRELEELLEHHDIEVPEWE